MNNFVFVYIIIRFWKFEIDNKVSNFGRRVILKNGPWESVLGRL